MAGLSGIVKKISDLVTGTPADDDCFIFGKTDLKKITLAKLKDALGITSINSALETYEEFVTNEWYIGRYGNTKALVYNGNIPSKWNGNYQFMLNSGNLLPEKYRPQKGFGIVVPVTNTGIKCLVDIRKEGGIYITPSEDIADKQWITIFIPYI